MSSAKPLSPWPGPSSDSVAIPRVEEDLLPVEELLLRRVQARDQHDERRPLSTSPRPAQVAGDPAAVERRLDPLGRRVEQRVRGVERRRSPLASSRGCARRRPPTRTSRSGSRRRRGRTPPRRCARGRRRARPRARARGAPRRSRVHASSHSSQRSMRAVVVRKSLGSTPFVVNRGAQLSMAACTRASGTGHHLLEVESEVCSSTTVAALRPGRAGDRARPDASCRRSGRGRGSASGAAPHPGAGRSPPLCGERAVAAVERPADHVRGSAPRCRPGS